MKKTLNLTIASIVIMLISGTLLHGQTVRLGIGGGVGYSKMNLNKSFYGAGKLPTRGQSGLRLAIPIEIGFGKFFALQPEFQYNELLTTYNASYREVIFGETIQNGYSGNFNYKTVELPVLAKLKLGSERFKAYLMVGPSVALPIKGKWNFKQYITVSSNSQGIIFDKVAGAYTFHLTADGYSPLELDSDELAFSKFLFNAHLGGGFEINFGRIGILIEARYIKGLNDLFPDGQGDESSWSAKQRTLSGGLGIMLAFGDQ